MLITVCDVSTEHKDDVERSGGKIARTWNGLMDVQFKDHMLNASNSGIVVIESDSGAQFVLRAENYSRIYIQ